MPYNSEFETSLEKWNAYKASINNSYTYTTTGSSIWGYIANTSITVKNGVVTGRLHQGYKIDYHIAGTVVTSDTTLIINFTEDAASLNTHPEGQSARTMDELYAKAKAEWLSVDKNKNEITFTTDNRGILYSCGYTPKNCNDDCFNGVTIKSITSL